MTETPQQQKRRILLENPEMDASYYDTCIDFGYMPESFDGMWKLHMKVPIVRLSKNWAIAIEVTGQTRRNREVFRPRLVRAKTREDRSSI